MITNPSNAKTTKEIHTMFKKETLLVDNKYQRKSIWLEQDNVRLIETILLKMLVPVLFFWKSSTDPDTGESIMHIVDGQQRINAVVNFIEGEFSLKEEYLLEKKTKEKWAGKSFSQLSTDDKTAIWNYPFTIIEINSSASFEDITSMFRRLNLTDYGLNDQERRNSMFGEFSVLAREISENNFWEKHRIFNSLDIKRMKDIEFCATLILLSHRGIFDQIDKTSLNQAYEDYQHQYPHAERDKKSVVTAISVVDSVISRETIRFIRRKVHLYTIFSVVFYSMRNSNSLENIGKRRLCEFISLYNLFKVDFELTEELTADEKIVYDLLKEYKSASVAMTASHINRMKRFASLKKFVYELTKPQIEAQENLKEKMTVFKSKISVDVEDLSEEDE